MTLVFKYHSKMWYNVALSHFATPNFAVPNPPPKVVFALWTKCPIVHVAMPYHKRRGGKKEFQYRAIKFFSRRNNPRGGGIKKCTPT